jgi:anti-sigma factor RsiW
MNSQHSKHYSEEDLLLHYYGETSREERSRMESHLAGCQACREVWQSLQRTLGAVPRINVTLSHRQTRDFAARVARRAGRRRLSRGWLLGGALATAGLLALTLSIRPPTLFPGAGNNSNKVAEATLLQEMDLLQKMEMLEQLDLLQELDGQG